jgi:argininosuccinate synthase
MRIVLAYSGGLQMSAAIPWLAATYRSEVITVTLDLGVGADLEGIRDRALSLGAARAHVLDVREVFVRDYLLKALGAAASLDEPAAMQPALWQSLLGRTVVEIARFEEAGAVAHGCAGDDLDRFERIIKTIAPAMRLLAPARDRHATEAEVANDLHARGVELRGPQKARVNRHAGESPAEPALVDVTFQKGVPTAVNGIPMAVVELVENLEMIAAAHSVRGSETASAAAFVLQAAYRELRAQTPNDVREFSAVVARRYLDLVLSGQWFTPLRDALDAFVRHIQLDGTIRLQLFNGECRTIAGSKSAEAGSDSPVRSALTVA